jgi:hypothetical protein
MQLLSSLLFFYTPQVYAGIGVSTQNTTVQTTSTATQKVKKLPTIDYVSDSFLVQFHILDMIVSLPEEDILNIGLDGYYSLQDAIISPPLKTSLQIGLSVDVLQNNSEINNEYTEIWACLQPRIGAYVSEEYGLGLYIVPSIGWAYLPISTQQEVTMQHELAIGSGIQLSIWRR